MRILFLFSLPFLLSMLWGCRSHGKALEDGPMMVSVSILPLKYLVDSIGGGDFETLVVMPPGTNPETYEPMLSQMKAISRARVGFQIGLIDFENSLEKSLKSNALESNFVNLSDGMELIGGGEAADETHHRTGIDPHIWLSPTRMQTMALKVADALTIIRPDSAVKYAANLHKMISSIDSVDRYITQSFSELNVKSFLIFHPSLTYYAADYGLQQIPVESEGKEPSVSHMKDLVQNVLVKKINTVIYPQAQHHHTVEALIREAGLQAVPFDPVAYDWPTNMMYITEHIKSSLNE